MENYTKQIDVRWADLDPNFHVLHSRYYDYGAYVRMCFLVEHGVTPERLTQHNIGPILFREECLFKREIRFEDKVIMDLSLIKARKDASRWSIRHQLVKNKQEVAAIITIDGAWLDTVKRRLGTPPPEFAHSFLEMPKAEGFEWI